MEKKNGKENLLSIYKRKEIHFVVFPLNLLELTGEEYNLLKQKVIDMIWVMEDAWNKEQLRKQKIK